MKKEKGITLVSLVVMIIVILIIASIGINGTKNSINLANYTAFQTELKIIQTKTNEICANEIKEQNGIITKPTIGTNASTHPTLEVREVNQILQEKTNKAGKTIEQIKQGFNLWTKTDINEVLKLESITQDFLVNIEECIVIALEPFYYEGINYYMSEQMEDSIYNVTHKNQIEPGEIKLTAGINPITNKNQIKVDIQNSKYISKWDILYKKKEVSKWEKANDYQFDVNEKGTYNVQANHNNEIKLESEIEITETPVKPNENGLFKQTATVDGKEPSEINPIIPEGFKPSDQNPRPTPEIIDKGFIITDEQAEFVWVPVPNINDMVGGMGLAKEQRWGKLYSSTNINNPENNTNLNKPRTGYREPDVLDGPVTDRDENNLRIINNILGTNYNINTFKTKLEEDFYKMSESVKKYKGFYIGRYESSLVGTGNTAYLAPIRGKTSVTPEPSKGNTWYGLYAKQKKFKKGNIEASMVWGCQYDAMLKWMKRAGVRQIETPNPIDITGIQAIRNQTRIGGNEERDKLCNVYDLIGNSFEWTLEADKKFNTNFRVYRGGKFDNPNNAPSNRSQCSPTSDGIHNSTRATLYIP